MEVRCGNCKKLFRVSDDKITGKGIKFACTRCGEFVKITMDDFVAYTLSHATVSAPEMLRRKPIMAATGIESKASQVTGAPSSPERISAERASVMPANELPKEPQLPVSSDAISPQGKEVLAASDLSHLEELSSPIERSADDSKFPFQEGAHDEQSDKVQAEPEQKHELQQVMATAAADSVPSPDLESSLDMVSESEAEAHPQTETGIAMTNEASEAAAHPQPAPQDGPAVAAEPELSVEILNEAADAARAESGTGPADQPEPVAEAKGAPEQETGILRADEVKEPEQPVPVRGTQPESQIQAEAMPVAAAHSEIQLEQIQADKPDVRQEIPHPTTDKDRIETRPADRPKPAVVSAAPGGLKIESARRISSSLPPITAEPADTRRSGSKAMIIAAVIILLVAGSIGAFMYFRFTGMSTKGSRAQMISTEGLSIVNASGSLEQNGDLVITGFVENSTDEPRSSWLVAVIVYDAKGAVVNELRLLNGKQIYTRSDYDILEKRGERVQEMKAKALHEQGTVIPAKGKVPFEVRYLQPPAGIASFNAILQPFDPARLSKEAEDQLTSSSP